jgi:hypothetical protein
MRKIARHSGSVSSLLDEPGTSALRILHACTRSTMSFWVDDRSRIRAGLPSDVPRTVEHLIVGTYGVGTPIADIEEDLRETLRERARSWITD